VREEQTHRSIARKETGTRPWRGSANRSAPRV